LSSVSNPSKESAIGQLVSVPVSDLYLDFAYLGSQELWKDYPDHELDEEFDKLVSQIKRRRVSARLAGLEYDIKSAEKGLDKKRLSVLMEEFSKISQRLNN